MCGSFHQKGFSLFFTMKTLIILFIFIGTSVHIITGSPTSYPFEDHESETRQTKIVGGSAVSIKQYPYQVSLQIEKQHFCGGSIISDLYILTAAHCTRDLGTSPITVRAGTSYWESGGVVIGVQSIYAHPKYAKETAQDYDVSILKLKKLLPLTDKIQIVGLPSRAQKDGAIGTITGWGALSEKGALPKQLMATDINVLNRNACAKQYVTKKYVVTDRMVCAFAPNKDSCYGDSGGPFVSSNGFQIGITSWGYGCNREGFPGVYTDISHPSIKSWIYGIINPSGS